MYATLMNRSCFIDLMVPMLSSGFRKTICFGNRLRCLVTQANTLEYVQAEPRINSASSTFSLRQRNGFNLVDKTAELQRLLAVERKCFLCRPPRFGKTLIMTLLSSLFRGERELFDGTIGRRLSIADGGWDWNQERHAVLFFNMGSIARRRNFENSLRQALMAVASQLGISDAITRSSIMGATEDLLTNAAKISPSGKLVILVDNADAPVAETLFMDESDDRPMILETNSKILHDFFKEIGNTESRIRFQMYAGTGYFDFPGHLDDLTFDQSSLTLVGYTKDEIHQCFAKRLQFLQGRLQKSEEEVDDLIEDWYGGYNWGSNDAPTIHNPFAVNELMRQLQFGPHWSTSMESMLWLLGFISNKQVANPFQGKLPLISRLGQECDSHNSSNQAEDDIHLLLLKLGLLSIHRVELDECTMIRNGILGVPNIDVDEYTVKPLIDALYRAQNDMM